MPSICGSDGTFGDPAVDECVTASCCEPFNTCYNDATCLDCLTGMGTGCDSNSDLSAFMACAEPCLM